MKANTQRKNKMSKTTLPKELEQRFDELVHYIKNIPVGQYNQNGVNIGYKKADDVIKDFIATALAQAEERVKQQVVEMMKLDMESVNQIIDQQI